MVDSGGQYLDGTTDVTRTFHYGTPTDEMIDRYTEVLQVFFLSIQTPPHRPTVGDSPTSATLKTLSQGRH